MISAAPAAPEQHLEMPTTAAVTDIRARQRPDPRKTREGEDDYAERMRLNLFAAIALIALVGAGIWLANVMVSSEKAHGCYSSGEHTCSLI